MKILYVATIGGFMPFFKTIIRELLDNGHTVDIATNMTEYPLPVYYKEWGCGVYQISCSRTPLSKGNIDAIKEIKKIVTYKHYDIVHCHTPIAAMCTRVACCRVRNSGTKVIYTAHGFHFYKGAPLKNWIVYYPIEKICAHWTDMLITINEEDYGIAKKKMKAKRIEYLPGVGIDVDVFINTTVDRNRKRKELGIPVDAFFLLSVGELNINKNHSVVIEALGKLRDPQIYYGIAGKGDRGESLSKLAKTEGIDQNFKLLGYRADILEVYKVADAYILPSIREGLNVSVMEAMACGLPCIVSKIRGNVDLIDEGRGGLLVDPMNVNSVALAIKTIVNNRKDNIIIGKYNMNKSNMYKKDCISNKTIDMYISMIEVKCKDEICH